MFVLRLDCILFAEFLVADLALSTISVPSFTLASPSLLTTALDTHPPDVIILKSEYLSSVLELILDDRQAANNTLIVVGEENLPNHLDQIQKNVRIHFWADLEGQGRKLPELDKVTPPRKRFCITLLFAVQADNFHFRTRRCFYCCALRWPFWRIGSSGIHSCCEDG